MTVCLHPEWPQMGIEPSDYGDMTRNSVPPLLTSFMNNSVALIKYWPTTAERTLEHNASEMRFFKKKKKTSVKSLKNL